MRLSTDNNDPGFDAWTEAIGRHSKIIVRLDGVEQRECCTADDEAGLVVRCVLDADGRVQVDPATNDSVLVETVRGKVEIELVP